MAEDPSNQFKRDDQDVAGDSDNGTYIAPEEPLGVHAYGTTQAEERRGEGFYIRDRHTQDESIDNPGFDPTRSGQLVQPGDEDVDRYDDEASVIAVDLGQNYDGDVSAEEAAMHVVSEDT